MRAPSTWRRTAIALSRPGYLGTQLASGRTPEEQADLYAATLDALGIDRTAVVAISGGGLSAIRFALRHPGRCRALVLASTVGAPMAVRLPPSFHLKMSKAASTSRSSTIARSCGRG